MDNPTKENLAEAQRLGQILSPSADKEKPASNVRKKAPYERRKNGVKLRIDVADFIEMRKENASYKVIAEKYNISVEELTKDVQVARKRGLLKPGDVSLVKRYSYGLTKEMYYAFKEEGKHDSWIRKEFQMGAVTLIDLKKEWGYPMRGIGPLMSKEEVLEYFKLGLSITEIAEQIGKERSSVYNAMRKFGITKVLITQLRNEYKKQLHLQRRIL